MSGTYQALLDDLVTAGDLPRDWLPAFAAVPRNHFIPKAIWEATGNDLQPVLYHDEPAHWYELVYANQPIITQADDGKTKPGEVGDYITSSCSQPSIVAMMLDRLEIRPHHRVLEIGTGTGWNAGILAARLGDEQVVSVEIDPELADRARACLADLHLRPQVHAADGAAGWPDGSPYDRVLATASVQRVPYAWVEQTRPGGKIVTPWGTSYDNGGLLRLDVQADGTASGNFIDNSINFMRLRAQRIPYGAVEDRVLAEHDYDEIVSHLHPWEPLGTRDGSFAVGLRVPHCQVIVVADDDGRDNHFVAYLMDPLGKSWASVHVEPEMTDEIPVRQHGPRNLWREVEAAHAWWTGAGKPSFDRFGVTVRKDVQWVWLDVPERIVSTDA